MRTKDTKRPDVKKCEAMKQNQAKQLLSQVGKDGVHLKEWYRACECFTGVRHTFTSVFTSG